MTLYVRNAVDEMTDKEKQIRRAYLAGREEGWDGYDALPITKETFQAANDFLKNISAEDKRTVKIFANTCGSIIFEWSFHGKLLCSFDVKSTGKIVAFSQDRRLKSNQEITVPEGD